MTFWLLETCLVNSLVASLMALAVWGIGRCCRRPALTHALWVLVLLKLITPPLFELPVGFRLDPLAQQLPLMENPIAAGLDLSPGIPSDRKLEDKSVVGQAPAELGFATNSVSLADSPQEAGCEPPSSSPSTSPLIAYACPEQPSEATGAAFFNFSMIWPALLLLWAVGSMTWFSVIAWRLLRFQRFLTCSEQAPAEVSALVGRLSQSLGLRGGPSVHVIDARFSPMLWAGFGRAKIILPSELLTRIESAALETLLLHELAHYYRRDHLVRLLEVLVTGLFWWHPVVWIARREIEVSEENCCDAWVVNHFAAEPRRYAEALLETVDFLAELPTLSLVPAATGLGEARFLRQRIVQIFEGVAPKSMSRVTRCVVVAMSICMLTVGPQLFTAAAHTTLELVAQELPLASPPLVSVPTDTPPDPIASTPIETPAPRLNAVSQAYEVPPVSPYKADVSIWASATSAEERFELVAKTDGTSLLIDHNLDRQFDFSAYRVAAAAFSPAGTSVALATNNRQVCLIDCLTGELLAEFAQPTSDVRTLAFSPEGSLLAAGTSGGVIHLFDLETQTEVTTIVGPQAAVNCVRFSSDAQRLAIASGSWMSPGEGRIVLWNLSRAAFEPPLATGIAQATAVFTGDDQLLATDWDGSTIVFDLTEANPSRRLQLDKNLVSLSAFSPSNDLPLIEAMRDALRRQPLPASTPYLFNLNGTQFTLE